jgi:hypothetical protein
MFGQETVMKKHTLSTPQLMFVVATRAMLGAGIGLLAGTRLKGRAKRAGLTLALIGAATTIPAAKLAFGKRRNLWERLTG